MAKKQVIENFIGLQAQVDREALSKALEFLSAVYKRPTTLSAFNHVILRATEVSVAGEGILELIAQSNAIGGRIQIPATVSIPGAVFSPGQLLLNAINKSGRDEVTISGDERFGVTVLSGRSKTRLNGIDPGEAFNTDYGSPFVSFGVQECELLKSLNVVKYSMCAESDSARQHLAGTHFVFDGDIVELYSSDTHRVARTDLHTIAPVEYAEKSTFIVSDFGVRSILSTLNSSEEEVALNFSPKWLSVNFTGETHPSLSIARIEGKTPNFSKAMDSATTDIRLEVNANEIKGAIGRAQVVLGDELGVDLEVAEDGLILRATPSSGNSMSEEIEAIQTGIGMAGSNAQYLSEAVQAIGSEAVSLDMTDQSVKKKGTRVIFVRPLGAEKPVVMVLQMYTRETKEEGEPSDEN